MALPLSELRAFSWKRRRIHKKQQRNVKTKNDYVISEIINYIFLFLNSEIVISELSEIKPLLLLFIAFNCLFLLCM